MRNAEKIENFIRSVFEVYGLNYGQYFSAYTEDEEIVEIPMVIGEELDMAMVRRAAEVLGENIEDLLSMNYEAAAKWQNRFSFISQKQAFEHTCNRRYYGKDYDTLRLMEVVWDVEYPNKPQKYDYKGVTERLWALLKEYDEVVPGTYHEGANIKHLYINTATFCRFPEMEQMMASFFEMVERAKVLFFKALEADLSASEINEYNIIASVLGIQDRCVPQKGELHYSMLRKLAPVYKAEQQADFFDYVMLDPAKDIAPWRCAEFVQNRDMVQAYVNILPGTKKAMREYALLAAQFHCSFAWADAAPLNYSPAGDNEIEEIGRMAQFIRLNEAYGGLEPTSIYVPKTAEELGDDDAYADMLKQLTGPVARGGLVVPAKLRGRLLDIPKMISRINALGGSRNE